MASNPGPSAILTEAHYQQLKNALDQAANVQREIDLAKLAGLDVTLAQQTLSDSTGKIRQLKSVYFPGR
jgi:hypothetical protein